MHIITMTKLTRDKDNGSSEDFNEIVDWQSNVSPADYERFNKCPICCCELFTDSFETMSVAEIADEQEQLLQVHAQPGADLNEKQAAQLTVVMLGSCQGEPHLFHQECI